MTALSVARRPPDRSAAETLLRAIGRAMNIIPPGWLSLRAHRATGRRSLYSLAARSGGPPAEQCHGTGLSVPVENTPSSSRSCVSMFPRRYSALYPKLSQQFLVSSFLFTVSPVRRPIYTSRWSLAAVRSRQLHESTPKTRKGARVVLGADVDSNVVVV